MTLYDYIVITPNGTTSHLQMTELPSHEVLGHVLNGWVERVRVLWQGRQVTMYVNELAPSLHLPTNFKATAIYHNATRHGRGYDTYDDLSRSPLPYLAEDLVAVPGTVILWTGPLD